MNIDLFYALEDLSLDAYQRSIAVHILRRGVCWEKSRALGERCGMSHTKAGKVIAELDALGVIVPASKNGHLGWKINPDICKPDLQTQQNDVNEAYTDVNEAYTVVSDVYKTVNHVYTEGNKEDKQTKITKKIDPPSPKKPKRAKKQFDPHSVPIPDELKINGLPQRIAEFIDFRKDLGKPYKTQRGVSGLFGKLKKYPPTVAEAMIDNAIANEWLSVYPLKGDELNRTIGKGFHGRNGHPAPHSRTAVVLAEDGTF